MNLPIISALQNDQSTYIAFSKSYVDYDRAIANGTPYYFSKMVALNLPLWQHPEFFIDLSVAGETSTNPNIVLPKAIQYYMENIIRNVDHPQVTEIAFYKLLNKCGLSYAQIQSAITFVNSIFTSNFVTIENNNGWGEIILQIPNKSKKLNKVFVDVVNLPDIVESTDIDGMFDNGNKQFLFDNKQVIDFSALTYDEVVSSSFQFNALLVFYTDDSGKEKLHGINFIHPFENKVTYFDLETFTQKTNDARSIGYQFKLNMKTCNNEASQLLIYELQEHSHWNTFGQTLGLMNSFLQKQMRS